MYILAQDFIVAQEDLCFRASMVEHDVNPLRQVPLLHLWHLAQQGSQHHLERFNLRRQLF